jgi:hypothetical protein
VKKHRIPPPKYFEVVVGNKREKVKDTGLTKWSFYIKSREDQVNIVNNNNNNNNSNSTKQLGDSSSLGMFFLTLLISCFCFCCW